jgi:Ca2+-binding RTX toxin-like protein
MPRAVSNLRYAVTPDFRISDSAAQTQIVPVIAALPGGGFVAVWSDTTFGTSTIRAQRFDRNGREVGSEFVVGQGPESVEPAVASLSSGGFVVSWTVGGSPPNGFDIKGQVFDSSGGTVGALFTANTTLPGFQVDSRVSGLAGGGFVITWQQPNDGTFDNIHGQVFAADGTKVGSEFLGGDAASGVKDANDVVALTGGGFVVAWHQPGVDGDRTGTRAQIFDASGNKVGAAFGLNTVTTGYQQAPELAALPSGGFVAVWTDDGDTASGNPNNGNQGVWAQLFDANGAKIGDDIKVSAAGADMPDVEIIPGVGFVVVWKDLNAAVPESFGGLRAQLFDFDGNKTGEEFSINPGLQDIQNLPDVTALSSGALVIGWSNWVAPQFNDEDVRARILFPTTLGTAGANTIAGTADRDFIFGLDGDDQLSGDAEDDALDGGEGNDSLSGGMGNDELTGGAGQDVLDGGSGHDALTGGAGADQMSGGTGNDTYFVDNVGDAVIEAVGEGFDAVYASVSYALIAGSEVEWLSASAVGGTGAINLFGNELANTILGNNGINLLNGGGGADALVGYGGNDTYYVDNASDVIIEAAGAGSDALYTTTSYALAGGVSVEWLSTAATYGTDAINLTGNAFANTILGNQGANIISGGGGADVFIGYGGDDTYFVDSQSDIVHESVNGGYDAIYTSVSYSLIVHNAPDDIEWLSTSAVYGTAPINLTGNAGNNVILGNDGNNILEGRGGIDTIYGYGGADTFYFQDVAPPGRPVTIASFIGDFTVGTDKIGLNNGIFALGTGAGPLPASAFVNGTAAGDADDRVIYNSATGELYYDFDGSGSLAQVLFAVLLNHAPISAADIQVI